MTARRSGPLRGEARAPGDKSISHRALILGGLAHGTTRIEGLLEGADVLATARAVEAFGARVARLGDGRWRVEGVGGFRQPSAVIDCGNSGTGVRLLMGAAAPFPIDAAFDGDASLRSRPMGRVIDPLSQLGARFESRDGRLPLISLADGRISGGVVVQTAPSAQVKSAVLLAGLNGSGVVRFVEDIPTRDHTERMLRAFGAIIDEVEEDGRRTLRIAGGQRLAGAAVVVPGDPSSAAFPLVAALLVPGSRVTVGNVLLNPLRTGLFETLREMGARLSVAHAREEGGEPVGDVTAEYGPLTGVTVPPDRAASMIDEYPILAAAAAFASGETVMRGIGELRVKESDRIALMARGLAACGADVAEEADGLVVRGSGGAVRGGARVETRGDHRIAMSHLVLGLAAEQPVTVDEPGMIATSFPTFVALMRSLGAAIEPA
ncbi:MAG: 3-phosphoshikimate 1-carboxyvinyltransferase [Caulobacteraceae bacterium]|nr:3-phosphoshikimate 1-carboxyvinyltransferase [Caulobacteraceae bacterium]